MHQFVKSREIWGGSLTNSSPKMTSNLDIYRSAKQLVDQFGADAPIEAAIRADQMLDIGDLDGLAV